MTPVSAKEHRKIKKQIKKRYERLRKRYPEVHGKVVDFISHSIEDGTLYISVRFKDKTDFSLRYACDMFVVGGRSRLLRHEDRKPRDDSRIHEADLKAAWSNDPVVLTDGKGTPELQGKTGQIN